MKIRKFNESNQSVIQYIRECFIDLVESTLSDDISIDDALYFDEEHSHLRITIGLPCLGFNTDDDILSQMVKFNNILNSRYDDIIHCIEKVKLSHPSIEYLYEIMSTETKKINGSVYIPYMQYIEIVFNV